MWTKKLLSGDDLRERAKELGIVVHADGPPPVSGFLQNQLLDLERELQSLVMNAERHQREHRLWIVALVSAIFAITSALASGLSAGAAWWAITHPVLQQSSSSQSQQKSPAHPPTKTVR